MKKTLYNIVGTLALLLGIVGIFLPLVPTTPFLLLASACYMRGSRRMHEWLLNQRHLGPYLRNFQQGRGIPLRAKITALALLWTSLTISMWFAPLPWVRILLLIPGIAVTVYLYRMPTLEPGGQMPNQADQIKRE
ncbi:YbaN family protein [Achromobacter sp. F4_2707]|uniref:YbaN family protein n=1 Tax=Achromobacter sp. F4_2707 TaxID=3114286 RepID=UPI0039C6E08E